MDGNMEVNMLVRFSRTYTSRLSESFKAIAISLSELFAVTTSTSLVSPFPSSGGDTERTSLPTI